MVTDYNSLWGDYQGEILYKVTETDTEETLVFYLQNNHHLFNDLTNIDDAPSKLPVEFDAERFEAGSIPWIAALLEESNDVVEGDDSGTGTGVGCGPLGGGLNFSNLFIQGEGSNSIWGEGPDSWPDSYGLPNQGATCHFNAAMQIIMQNQRVISTFNDPDTFEKLLVYKDTQEKEFLKSFKTLFDSYRRGEDTSVHVAAFVRICINPPKEIFSSF